MTTFQIVMLVLAALATLYQVLSLVGIHAKMSHAGEVIMTDPLKVVLVICVLIQVVFVISLTGIQK